MSIWLFVILNIDVNLCACLHIVWAPILLIVLVQLFVMNVVAAVLIFSSLLIFVCVYGSHTAAQYSSIKRTSVL